MGKLFYYKVETDEGFNFYGVKIFTKKMIYIDSLLDQINNCNGIFIKRKEFDKNVKETMEVNIMDAETENEVLGVLIFKKQKLFDGCII